MWPYQLTYTLKVLRMKFRKKRKLTAHDLDQVLNSGGSLILIYDTLTAGSHAVFIDGMTGGCYRVWNRGKNPKPFTSKEYIHDALKRSGKRPGHLYAFVFAKPPSHSKV